MISTTVEIILEHRVTRRFLFALVFAIALYQSASIAGLAAVVGFFGFFEVIGAITKK